MNKASRIAQGEWIIFINSGDTFASDIVCKKLLSEEISSFDILYGDHFSKILMISYFILNLQSLRVYGIL